jgi:hypothetical protein
MLIVEKNSIPFSRQSELGFNGRFQKNCASADGQHPTIQWVGDAFWCIDGHKLELTAPNVSGF